MPPGWETVNGMGLASMADAICAAKLRNVNTIKIMTSIKKTLWATALLGVFGNPVCLLN